MGLKREKNRARALEKIQAVRAMAEEGHMAATAEYRELKAQDMYALQVAARKEGVAIKVIRNRLAHRALEGTAFSCLQPVLKGPVLLAFSKHEPRAVARLLRDFSKTHAQLVIKSFAFEGALLPASDLDRMANLPTKEEAIIQLLSVLQSPVYQLLGILVEPYVRLTKILMTVKAD